MLETTECAVSSDFKRPRIWTDINQAAMQFIIVKLTDPVSCTSWKFYWLIDFIVMLFFYFRLWNWSNNILTRHSRSGKHGRFGHVIECRGRLLRVSSDFEPCESINNNPAQCPICFKSSIQQKRTEGSLEKEENSRKCVFVPMVNDKWWFYVRDKSLGSSYTSMHAPAAVDIH